MDPIKEAQIFLDKLFSELNSLRFDLPKHWDIDHICYRVESEEQYHKMKEVFSSLGQVLIESEVNGRLISTIQLNQPICYQDYQIYLVELPAPKKGKVVKTGFEHVEIVCDLPFADIVAQAPNLAWDQSGLSKLFNKELELCLSSGAVKFHHLSLLSVVNLEKNKKAWSAITDSKVLSHFQDYQPLIAGTFPLGLQTPASDIDVLLETNDLAALQEKLTRFYGHCDNFKLTLTEADGLPTLLCRFTFSDFPFEIFAQNTKTVSQTAYRHFLAEEKLLKIGGRPSLQHSDQRKMPSNKSCSCKSCH